MVLPYWKYSDDYTGRGRPQRPRGEGYGLVGLCPCDTGDLTSSIASNVEDLRGWQRALTSVVLQQAGGMGGENAVEKWCDTNRRDIARSGDMIAEFEAGDMDIGKLALANR